MRAQQCSWGNILQRQIHGEDRNLLEHHGLFLNAHIEDSKLRYQAYTGRPNVYYNQLVPTLDVGTPARRTYEEGTRIVQATQHLFNCITKSLTQGYKKTLAKKLPKYQEDGVALLWDILQECPTTTHTHRRNLISDLRNAELKQHKYSPVEYHKYVDEVKGELQAQGHDLSDDDQIIYLFDTYKKHTHKKWDIHITNVESKWCDGTFTTPRQIRESIEQYYNMLVVNKEWHGKTSSTTTNNRSSQREKNATALPADDKTSSTDDDKIARFKKKHAAWKFDKSLSNTNKLTKNGKTYIWCKGPGHFGIGMWVLHEKGSCTNAGKPEGQANATDTSRNTNNNTSNTSTSQPKKKLNHSTFKAMLTEQLTQANTFGDDLTELVNAIASKTFE